MIGFVTGDIPRVPTDRRLLRNIRLVGVAFGAFLGHDDELMRHQAVSMAPMVEAGVIDPHLSEIHAFGDLPQALERLDQGQMPGKAVVRVGPKASSSSSTSEAAQI